MLYLLRHTAFVTVVLMLMAGCEAPTGPDDREPPRELAGYETAAVEAEQLFGLSLLQALHADSPEDNVFVSPLSVSMALGMALNGAGAGTHDEMQQALALQGLSQEEINQAYRDLIDLLTTLDPAVTVEIANAIWHRDTFDVEEAFLDVNREHFGAEVGALDFTRDDAADVMNAWVEEQTNGRIADIVDPPIDPLTKLFLMNAVYFQGDWVHRFDADRTTPEPFTRADGSTVEVDMMRHGGGRSFAYHQAETFDVIDLPYGDSLYSMTIVLPHEEVPLSSVVETLDADRWTSLIEALQPQQLQVEMPRFELSYNIGLVDALTALGMEEAFDAERSDFSRINPDYPDLHISDVQHSTFLRVDEEGTEAAAATSVEVGVESAPPGVKIDRPFVLAIRERHSGVLLFIGQIHDPTR